MMPDLATHLLEIIQNSIAAGARNVCIRVLESIVSNTIVMEVEDDGKGMSEETVRSVTDPFTTSRTTRKVGLGTSFLKGLT
ncbi:MAG: sensor histidine kinase, partial [Solobacterium sp.]|nr:sensor histidine kinase [Solobacterium sp.]